MPEHNSTCNSISMHPSEQRKGKSKGKSKAKSKAKGKGFGVKSTVRRLPSILVLASSGLAMRGRGQWQNVCSLTLRSVAVDGRSSFDSMQCRDILR